MTAVAETPTGTSVPARGRRVTAVVLALLGIALLVWAVPPAAIVRFAPAAVEFEQGAPAAVVHGFGGEKGTYVVGYEHDGYTTLSVRLENRSALPLGIEEVRLVSQRFPLLVPVGSVSSRRLGPGASADVPLSFRFDNCEYYHERAVMQVDALEVHGTVLGRSVVELVPLDRPLAVRSPMISSCPDRTIDRQDHVRGG